MLQLIALLLILYQGLLELVLSQTMFFLEASPDDGFIFTVQNIAVLDAGVISRLLGLFEDLGRWSISRLGNCSRGSSGGGRRRRHRGRGGRGGGRRGCIRGARHGGRCGRLLSMNLGGNSQHRAE